MISFDKKKKEVSLKTMRGDYVWLATDLAQNIGPSNQPISAGR